MRYRCFAHSLLAVIAFALPSCSNTPAPVAPLAPAAVSFEPPAPSAPKVDESRYSLQTGDKLEIKFFYNPELNESVIIGPDGKICLQLIGELSAVGMTRLELNEMITDRYKLFLQKPQVTVILKQFDLPQVFVGGEVMKPGVFPWNETTTALRTILGAGGFKDSASMSSVIIVSKGRDGLPVARRVDLQRALSDKAPQSDLTLQPFDIVFVPKTFIAKANQFMKEYIINMMPPNLTAGFSYAIVGGRETLDTQVLH